MSYRRSAPVMSSASHLTCERLPFQGMDLAVVIGRNCKALRGPASMAELAEHARRFGARWNSGYIAKIEAGMRPSVATLVVLAAALESLTEETVRVEHLLKTEFDEPIELSDGVQVSNGYLLTKILRGEANLNADLEGVVQRSLAENSALAKVRMAERLIPGTWPGGVSHVDVVEAHLENTEGDDRIARSMGFGGDLLTAWSLKLWGKSFTAERDSRAGKQANAQKRGQITRQMKTEVQEAIEGSRKAAAHVDD